MLSVLRQVSEEAPEPVRMLNPEVPGWLEDLIMRLLAKAPEQRIGSAGEVASLLEGYLAHLQQPTKVNAPKLQPLAGQWLSPAGRRFRALSGLSMRIWVPILVLLAALGLAKRSWFLAGDGGVNEAEETARAKQAQEVANEKPDRKHTAFDLRVGL